MGKILASICIRTFLLLGLYSLFLVGAAYPQANTNKTTKAREKATQLAAGSNPLADLTLNSGKKLTGHVNSVAADAFQFTEKRSTQPQTILFADVAHIDKHGMTRGSWIAIAAIGGGVAIVLIALCPVYSWSCR